jgi:signal transduction histidine kinase
MLVTGWLPGAAMLRAVVVTLLAAQLVLLIIRSLSVRVRIEYMFLFSFCALLAILEIMPPAGFIHSAMIIAASWAGTGFLIRVQRRTWLVPWSAGSAAFIVVLLLADGMGYGSTLPYHFLSAFGIAVLSAMPLGLLIHLHRASGAAGTVLAFLAGVAWLAAGAVDVVLDAAGRAPLILSPIAILCMSVCTGWLIFQQGYPLRPGWGGSLPAAESHDATRALYTRLLASESALAWQNRLIGSGVLAAGAAHEFKNTLSHVKTAAQHGLQKPDASAKDECLRLIVECSQAGRDSAVEVLERISSTDDEAPCIIDAARDLGRLLRMCQAAFRGQSITIESALDACVSFRARRCDLELVLLNLLRNAADAYGLSSRTKPSCIFVRARREGESAVVAVRDAAGGIPQEKVLRLFQPAASQSGGTGIGLYLSRNLVRDNGGSLEYQPIEGGSLFELKFPADGDTGGPGEELRP